MSLLKQQLTKEQKKKVKADLHVTKSPLGKEKFIVKSSGEVDKQEFPDSVFGEIDGVKFEIQSSD